MEAIMSRLHIEFTHIRCNQTEDKGDLFGDLSQDEFYITGSAIVGSAIKPILVSAVPDVNEKFKPIDIDDGQTLPIPSITGDIVADFDDNASDIILGAQAFDQDAADDKDVKNWIDLANAITDSVNAIGGDKVKTGTGLATAAIKAIDAARQSDKNDPLGTPLLLNQGDLSVSQLDPRSPIWLGRTWPLEPPRGTSWWNSYSYNVDYRIWREDYDFAVRDANSTFPNQLFSGPSKLTGIGFPSGY
jgi:hypothetical protein